MSKPKDLIALLEENFKQGKPLLQDAELYRGSRLPDQTQGSYAKDTMHGSLMSQVAASYTHNWSEDKAFIGAYKIDREQTRFYSDYGLEQKLSGKDIKSLSVQDAEKMLEPLVREYAGGKNNSDRARTEEKIESLIKKNLYESNMPTRDASGEPNRPKDLYLYGGKPDISIRRAVSMQMDKVGPHNENVAKAVMFKEHRSEAAQEIHKLSSAPTKAQESLAVLKQIAQRDFSGKMQAEHGGKPLNQMLDAIAKTPIGPEQERMGKFAKALVESFGHPNPAMQDKAAAISKEILKLDPASATYGDLAKASSSANQKLKEAGSSASATSGSVSSHQNSTEARGIAKAADMDQSQSKVLAKSTSGTSASMSR